MQTSTRFQSIVEAEHRANWIEFAETGHVFEDDEIF
jgi:hypothetical protein